jgi:hypothetical protein
VPCYKGHGIGLSIGSYSVHTGIFVAIMYQLCRPADWLKLTACSFCLETALADSIRYNTGGYNSSVFLMALSILFVRGEGPYKTVDVAVVKL